MDQFVIAAGGKTGKTLIFALDALLLTFLLTAIEVDPAAAQLPTVRTHATVKNGAQMLYQLTGHPDYPEAPFVDVVPGNTTHTQANVHKTDIGAMFFWNGKMHFAFGDTFGGGADKLKSWRYNVIATSTDMNPANGISFNNQTSDWFQSSTWGNQSVIPKESNGFTAIPTSGWAYGGYPLLWVMHVNSHEWKDPSTFVGRLWLSMTPNWSVPLPLYTFPPNSRFTLGTMVRRGDYLYVFGTQPYRKGYVYLARIPLSQLLTGDINNFRYWTCNPPRRRRPSPQYCGFNATQENEAKPIWTDTNRWGRNIGELSVIENPVTKKLMMLYFSEGEGNIYFRTSANPEGPWSEKQIAVDCVSDFDKIWNENCYGSYMHPKYVKNSGNTVYFIMSRMTPSGSAGQPNNLVYNTFLMKLDLQWH